MSKVVVAWYDNKGVEYNAQTIYDPETGEIWDWVGEDGGKWVLSQRNVADRKPSDTSENAKNHPKETP